MTTNVEIHWEGRKPVLKGASILAGIEPSGFSEPGGAQILIVTRSMLGFDSVTDAGATYAGMAQEFTAQGHSVKLLLVPPLGATLGEYYDRARALTRRLIDLYLIDADVLVGSRNTWRNLVSHELVSYALLDFVRDRNFDIVYYAAEEGLGFFLTAARKTGVLKKKCSLIAVVSQPKAWLRSANKSYISSPDDLVSSFMEMESVRGADCVICFNAYARRWLIDNSWAEDQPVIAPPPLPAEYRLEPGYFARTSGHAPDELVYIAGDGEYKDGLDIFCNALDRLLPTAELRRVTYMGKFGHILGEHTGGMFLRRARRWPFEVQIFPNQTPLEALGYLARGRRLAVFTAQAAFSSTFFAACLRAGIPLMAANSGCFGDLLSEEDRARCLFEPNVPGLTTALTSALAAPMKPPRAGSTNEDAATQWRALNQRWRLERVEQDDCPAREPVEPLVTVVMAHHDRPDLVVHAIESVERQDYGSIELILVDDGSVLEETKRLLRKLEPRFRRRGWRIIRQPNLYLGAARNAAIKQANGELILFLDDDNILFDNAVSTLVAAVQKSGADICTCLSRTLFDRHPPQDKNLGMVEYLPTGGPVEVSMIKNPFGDANAMFRRPTFDRIGLLVEDFGFACQDWEIFTRAALNGLKVQIVPEPLYWYRSNTEGMYRTSHYKDNRQPIISLFENLPVRRLAELYEIAISASLADGDRKSFYYNLHWDPANARMMKLSQLPANSDEVIGLLAELAAADGRPETAMGLVGQKALAGQAERMIAFHDLSDAEQRRMLAEAPAPLVREQKLSIDALRDATVQFAGYGKECATAYLEGDALWLEVRPGQSTLAVLEDAIPDGAIEVSTQCRLDPELPVPVEFRLLAFHSAGAAIGDLALDEPPAAVAVTPWKRLSQPILTLDLRLPLVDASAGSVSICIAARLSGDAAASGTFVNVSGLSSRQAVATSLARPSSRPVAKRRARALTVAELASARLLTDYPSSMPALVLPAGEEGLLTRANPWGINLTMLPFAMPAFGRRILATVELCDADAPPIEISMALARPDDFIEWRTGVPADVMGFSGWVAIQKPFELQTLEVSVEATMRMALHAQLAIRPLQGQSTDHWGVYWRKFVVLWS